jgi:hypothetical protein
MSTERAPEVQGPPVPLFTLGPSRFFNLLNHENLGFPQIVTRVAAGTAVTQKFRKTAAGGTVFVLRKRKMNKIWLVT